MMKEFNLKPKNIELIEPLDFLTFLKLESNAQLILTDSGGVQEEACILNVPCVTLRDNTERPETIDVGANVLAGATPNKILECAKFMLSRDNKWKNPFGDGKAGERIVKIVTGEQHA
jgi:UDP-N-acetylglucosamine 2-epimerase (non-hydrolysing)